ncbi:hypothetical protein [Hyalangium gracile]|uniref:hypothetical protein n=1 Tax=Hyalangium gracile TaxID=394092 RepID=UPI001CCDFEDB|nr:hypothetical protein [Hyalangium gracile]
MDELSIEPRTRAGLDFDALVQGEQAAPSGRRLRRFTLHPRRSLPTLEAELKRAQLELDKLLRSANPNDSAVMQQVEAVGRAARP